MATEELDEYRIEILRTYRYDGCDTVAAEGPTEGHDTVIAEGPIECQKWLWRT